MQKLFMIQAVLNRLVEVGATAPDNDPNWISCDWAIGDREGEYLAISLGDEGFEYFLVLETIDEEGTIKSVSHLKKLIERLRLNIVF